MLSAARLCLSRIFVPITAAATLVGAAPASAQGAAFASYGANSEGAALVFKVTYSGFASLFPIVDVSLGHVSGMIDSRPNARGYAAAADPGQAIQSLGALGVPMPAYPFMARAEYPGDTPRSRTSAGEQAVGPGTASGLVSEVGAAEGPKLDASAQEASFDAPGIITAGAASTRTSLSVGNLIRARTEVTVKDVVIGGVLRIATVHTVVESSAGGSAGSAKGDPRVELSGVSLAGQAATIDEHGVHLLGQEAPGSFGGLVAPLSDLLASAGFSVRLGEVHLTASPDGTSAIAGAEGIFVTYAAPDGSVAEYRVGWAAQTVGAVLSEEQPAYSDEPEVAPQSGGSLPSVTSAPVVPEVPQTRAFRPVAAVSLPAGMVALVGLAQLAFLTAMAATGLWARSDAPGSRREWLFDTIDRLRPTDL